MLIDLLPAATKNRSVSFTAMLRHFGAFGLFFLAILDSLPFPTFGGPDILTAVLAARHHEPWYVYAAAATSGSLIGAFITFRLARRAGLAYLHKHFGKNRASSFLRVFERWGTPALAISSAVPFPTPTSFFFAAAGASGYPARRYLIIVGLCRAARYSLVAFLAEHYRRHFVRAIQHPGQYWGWLLLFAAIIAVIVAGGIVINKHLETPSAAD